MFSISVETAAIKRALSNGATRVIFKARDDEDRPAAIFLCCVEPPDAFEQTLRESFMTICSVEDLAEYPVGVSDITEVDPNEFSIGTFLYNAQENKTYTRAEDGTGLPVWVLYKPSDSGLAPNAHAHKLPFFRRSAIDVILPNREFVTDAIGWVKKAALRLEKDMADIELLRPFNP